MKDTKKVYTVTELTRRVKTTLEGEFGSLWLEGELSNVRQPASGHYYFTIKDESCQISAVLFRGSQRELKFKPIDGIMVRVFGQISVYERSGNYQIIIRRMEEGGKGSLQARFEALKEKLDKEGLFAKERKQPLPMLPQHVGVVTSDTGAAIRDILNVAARRFPNLHIVLAPAKVQGETAAAEVAAAIDLLNKRGGLDAMIVGRGGGSLEDLWCFNEEAVARAIARSRIPIISAVGHEIDFTISDFVADLRAPTPSAAAEIVVGKKNDFEERLDELTGKLHTMLRAATLKARNRLIAASGSYVFREPGNMVVRFRQSLDGIKRRMEHKTAGSLRDAQQQLDNLWMRVEHRTRNAIREGKTDVSDMQTKMLHSMRLRHQSSTQDIRRLSTQLRALSPLAVLDRGYSVTRDKDGNILSSVEGIKTGELLDTQFAKGSIESEVKEVKPELGSGL